MIRKLIPIVLLSLMALEGLTVLIDPKNRQSNDASQTSQPVPKSFDNAQDKFINELDNKQLKKQLLVIKTKYTAAPFKIQNQQKQSLNIIQNDIDEDDSSSTDEKSSQSSDSQEKDSKRVKKAKKNEKKDKKEKKYKSDKKMKKGKKDKQEQN